MQQGELQVLPGRILWAWDAHSFSVVRYDKVNCCFVRLSIDLCHGHVMGIDYTATLLIRTMSCNHPSCRGARDSDRRYKSDRNNALGTLDAPAMGGLKLLDLVPDHRDPFKAFQFA